jgi:hypothetical protein
MRPAKKRSVSFVEIINNVVALALGERVQTGDRDSQFNYVNPIDAESNPKACGKAPHWVPCRAVWL